MSVQASPQTVATAPTAPPKARRLPGRDFFLGLLSVVVVLTVWQSVSSFGLISKLFLPAPTDILIQAQKLAYGPNGRLELLEHAITSTRRVLIGFALAASAAVPLSRW